MAFFVVTYTHPDEQGWQEQLPAHMEYLSTLLEAGTVRAAGPLQGTLRRSAMLILEAPSREAVQAVLAKDPFHAHGLVADEVVTEWEPVVGVFGGSPGGVGRAIPHI